MDSHRASNYASARAGHHAPHAPELRAIRCKNAASRQGKFDPAMKIVITGAAGLVGQNLVARLVRRGMTDIVAIDRHPANTRILRQQHPGITVVQADLAEPGEWASALDGAEAVVLAHAQIGGLAEADFVRNNVAATGTVLRELKRRGGCHVVHISSSVVNSAAVDWYTETKKAQERVVAEAGLPTVVLRPTLMFGWFDRKHLGWLGRFMRRTPIFPVPGDGQYVRQPLYAGDFCDIVIACLRQRLAGAAYNISGQERIAFIELMRMVRTAVEGRARIVRVPLSLFHAMLATYALFDRNPPFTTRQLKALVTPDLFEVIDWPTIFDVPATPLRTAVMETFRDPVYSGVELEF